MSEAQSQASNGGIVRDWTEKDGRSNSSDLYVELCAVVEYLIRQDAHKLIGGHADQTARLIVSHLAHRHGMVPGV